MQRPDITKSYVVNAEVTPLEGDTYQTVTASLVDTLTKEGMLEFCADIKTASAAPIVDGKPRMLHITAVIVHEGINLNGDGFYAEDLQKAVTEKRLFRDGYGGMIDINHDFSPIGYWYDAEYITDAQTMSGAILAKGAIWAWRFPEIADKVLADQHRMGSVPVSMTCVCKAEDVEFKADEAGRYISWNKNPVFIATTMLFDQDAGDKNARGVAEEDPVKITDQERKQTLLRAAALNDTNKNQEDVKMLEELKPLLETALGENAENVIEKITASLSNLEQKLDTRNAEVETLTTAKAELEEQNAELQTTIEEQNIAVDELKAVIEGLEATVAEQTESLDAYVAAEAQAAFEKLKEDRLAQTSDSVREKLAKLDPATREAIENRWARQSDEEWEVTKAEHALATSATARDDSRLPNPGQKAQSLDAYIL